MIFNHLHFYKNRFVAYSYELNFKNYCTFITLKTLKLNFRVVLLKFSVQLGEHKKVKTAINQ